MAARPSSIPVYLVDASIYIFQSHFSPYVECYDRAGNDLSAVYGFTQFLLQFLRRAQPRHVAIAHDESLFCGFRHALCPNYKSNRELPDENLAMQLQASKEICSILGMMAYGSKVYEADDIIGVLARRVRAELGSDQVAIHLVSKDKDLAQLLEHEQDCLWEFSANHKRFIVDIENDFGVSPVQIADFLALAGDSVDCISGVPGIGPVATRELLSRYGSLEGIYQHLSDIPALPIRGARRLASLLEEHRARAELSRQLATIVCEVDTPGEAFSGITFDDLGAATPDLDELRGFLVEYQFPSEESERLIAQTRRIIESRESMENRESTAG